MFHIRNAEIKKKNERLFCLKKLNSLLLHVARCKCCFAIF